MAKPPASPKPIGQILKEAGLLSDAQIQIALQDQARQRDLLFGEILVLRGWIKAQTLDFFLKHFVQACQSFSADAPCRQPPPPDPEDLSRCYAYAPPTRPNPSQALPKAKSPPAAKPSPKSPKKEAPKPAKGKLYVHGFCIETDEEDEELFEEDCPDWHLNSP